MIPGTAASSAPKYRPRAGESGCQGCSLGSDSLSRVSLAVVAEVSVFTCRDQGILYMGFWLTVTVSSHILAPGAPVYRGSVTWLTAASHLFPSIFVRLVTHQADEKGTSCDQTEVAGVAQVASRRHSTNSLPSLQHLYVFECHPPQTAARPHPPASPAPTPPRPARQTLPRLLPRLPPPAPSPSLRPRRSGGLHTVDSVGLGDRRGCDECKELLEIEQWLAL
jgi:hypothetical protein